jgi:hypothetical protein
MDFDTPDFPLKLVKESQTIAALQPKGANGFDFTPADRLADRSKDGFYHLGDLTLRLRSGDSGPWQSYSTATDRRPVTPLSVSEGSLAAADLTHTLPGDCPLQVTRTLPDETCPAHTPCVHSRIPISGRTPGIFK